MPGSATNFDLGTVDRISNTSGDTLLLSDDPNEERDTYASRVARHTPDYSRLTEDGRLETERYIGRDRRITAFERQHFRSNNITPDRPCTAFFHSGSFADSAAVFDALQQQDFPPQSIRCLQRRPSGEMLITFATSVLKDAFVRNNAFRIQNQAFVINDEDRPITFLNIYDAPYELPDPAIVARLAPYCEVVSSRRGKFQRSNVFNGMRHYRVRIHQPIPSYLRFGKFLIRMSHDGQQHTCRRCNRLGHFANECTNTVCFNCDELGHEARACPEPTRCCICKAEHHVAQFCHLSWYKSPSPYDQQSVHDAVSEIGSEGFASCLPPEPEHSPEEFVSFRADQDVAGATPDLELPSPHPDSPGDPRPSPAVDASGDALLSDELTESPDGRILDSEGMIIPTPDPAPGLISPEVLLSEELALSDDDVVISEASDSQPAAPEEVPSVPPGRQPAPLPAALARYGRAEGSRDPPPDGPPAPSPPSKPRSSRRKPAPVPALPNIGRRPTTPSRPPSGKKPTTAADKDPPPEPTDPQQDGPDMDLDPLNLKRKQDQWVETVKKGKT